MSDNNNEAGSELISVKDKLSAYTEFSTRIAVTQFYYIRDKVNVPSACSHDVMAQIDMKDGTKELIIDTIKMELKCKGESVKDFSKPIEPRIDYSIEISILVDHEEYCYSFNLKELKLYQQSMRYVSGFSGILSIIMTDGRDYILLKTYDERLRYNKKDELLWMLILCWERNYYVDNEFLRYVERQERLAASNNSFMSLFGTSTGKSSLNSTKKIENGYEELEKLIGLETIKNDIKELANFLKIQKKRKEKGMKTVPMSLHLVFTGNPGTGKTTIARILASIYKDIGALSKGHVVEVDRADLVAEYIGQTATKTAGKIKEAMGGILFIDEAYTLAKGDSKDFGQEAIDTLLKAMEDHRENFIVIVAGYPEQMHAFINSNPGLKSRFNKYIHFPDYTAKELLQIFKEMCDLYEYKLTEDAEECIDERIEFIEKNKKENFANARTIRNLFEKIITRQASRLADAEDDADLAEISAEDVPPVDDKTLGE